MKVKLESTSKLTVLCIDGVEVPARIWQGRTDGGIPVHAYITRIVPEVPKSDPDIDEKTLEFERELQRCADPSPIVRAIDARMIL